MTHLQLASKIHEKLMKPREILTTSAQKTSSQTPESENLGPELAPLPIATKVFAAVARAQARDEPDQEEPMGPVELQAERWRRIKVYQGKDIYLRRLKQFLSGDVKDWSNAQVRRIDKVAGDFTLDSLDVLYRLRGSTRGHPRDMGDELRLVVPKTLYSYMLHDAYEDFQGGHQGVTRTFEKLRSEFYWKGMHAAVQNFVWIAPAARGPLRTLDHRLGMSNPDVHLNSSPWIS
ncbi:unnamed protein product [Phytophthora fragariaefolia]|uniref:Unnamed protein product n=1 Tax=Phytophthora fragariaefolia TaxID=1490495 RepID=A0A9W7D6J5_9STRA|nr:unnamed protein product [Phytophthora fragariaefolia]